MSEEPDFYALLGVAVTATTKQISKAYRLKALKVHPDKVGAENLAAAETFLLLSQAVDCLTDAAKRATYDVAYKAKHAQQVRIGKLNEKRKNASDDLKRREEAFVKKAKTSDMNEAEIKRLREEGLRRLAEMTRLDEEERAAKQAKQEESTSNDMDHALWIKWKPKIVTLAASEIEALFTTFGEVEMFRVIKEGKALLLYKRTGDADKIFRKRTSFKDYTIAWTKPRPEADMEPESAAPATTPAAPTNNTSGFSFSFAPSTASSMASYEAETLRRMRERDVARQEALKKQ
ncbi:DnaJ (Hsp40), sub C, member 17 [Podochytrium sp. JEL0797]|nr:DnaJ (Hsp40), sub C, member 17 [Podochytrium sp. JEL0797]